MFLLIFFFRGKSNTWYDHATDESGSLKDLAELMARGDHQKDIPGYIVKVMNENELAKEMLTKHAIDPQVIHLDIHNLPLTEFMKALGLEHPVAADGDLRIYNSPYDLSSKGTMVINVHTNLWRDTKSGANGGIYDLAYELTGPANISELKRYIAGEMNDWQQRQAAFIAEKMQLLVAEPYKPMPFKEEPTFENVEISRLESPSLLGYLRNRGIPRDIAQRMPPYIFLNLSLIRCAEGMHSNRGVSLCCIL